MRCVQLGPLLIYPTAPLLIFRDFSWSFLIVLPASLMQGVRDMVKRWLQHFCEIGNLMKRLDVGEGNYAKELEEDYDVYDAMNSVSGRN